MCASCVRVVGWYGSGVVDCGGYESSCNDCACACVYVCSYTPLPPTPESSLSDVQKALKKATDSAAAGVPYLVNALVGKSTFRDGSTSV